MEFRTSRHRVVLCRYCASRPLYRYARFGIGSPGGLQLLYEFIHGTCSIDLLAANITARKHSANQHNGRRTNQHRHGGATPSHLHLINSGDFPPRWLFPL